ncbi:YtxH domain-containing protein [Thermoleptolyngbya sp.]|jgi:gas vesicle protein
MAENRSGSAGTFLAGAIVGVAIGAVTGLLLAPRTGRETRRLLKKSADALPEIAEDISSSVQIQADRLSGSALKNWDGTLSRLKEAIAVGIEASQRDRQATAQKDARPAPDPRPPARDSSLT